jgi:hypothetical protein
LLVTELDGDPGFQNLTEEEIAADVVKASAMEEGSDNVLDEPQESTIKKKLLSSARDGIDAVINYVGSSANRELQAYYEHLRTVRKMLIKEQQQRSVKTISSNLHYYIQKQIQLLSLLSMNKCI